MKRLLASISFVLWGCCLNAAAQEPLVRSSLAKQDEMWVGQRITIVVELLVPGYFSGAPSFDLPGLKGMLLIPPSGSPVVGSEQIDGISYTVQRYALAVFSRRAGEQTVPAFPVRFFYKRQPLDKDVHSRNGQDRAAEIHGKAPAGRGEPRQHYQRARSKSRRILEAGTWQGESRRCLHPHHHLHCARCASHGLSSVSSRENRRSRHLSERSVGAR